MQQIMGREAEALAYLFPQANFSMGKKRFHPQALFCAPVGEVSGCRVAGMGRE